MRELRKINGNAVKVLRLGAKYLKLYQLVPTVSILFCFAETKCHWVAKDNCPFSVSQSRDERHLLPLLHLKGS